VIARNTDGGSQRLPVSIDPCENSIRLIPGENQQDINEIYQDGLRLPVFYSTDLLAIAMGFDPDAIGLKEHCENGVEEIRG
jgi:heterodisulfide reductase subunit B